MNSGSRQASRHRRPSRTAAALALVPLLMGVVSAGPAQATIIKSPPWADTFGAKWPGANGLDTRASMNSADGELDQIGYFSTASTAMTAPTSMNTSYGQADAVWAAFGHANAGVMEFYNMSTGATTWLFASSGIWSGYGCGSPNDCISDYLGGPISRLKLMLFAGCYTSLSDSSGSSYDSLLDAARGAGVDNAMGFASTISWGSMDIWTARFFDDLQQGGTLANSADDAALLVLMTYGQYYGTASYVIAGNQNAVIRPAAYGS